MKKNKIAIILVLFQVVLFSSCLTTKHTNLLQEPGGDIPRYRKANEIGEYRIKSGDELAVQIMMQNGNMRTAALYSLFNGGAGDKLQTLAVSQQGTIYFPYVGDIYVAGKTTLDIQSELEARINREILVEDGCIVNVRLANRSFSIIGESGVGSYPIAKEQLTIYQALAQSGDVNQYGDRSQVKIIRRELDGTTIVKTFDLRSTTVINSEFYYIQPNDIIYIQPLKRQFWGVSSFSSIFAITTTALSFGVLIFNLTKK